MASLGDVTKSIGQKFKRNNPDIVYDPKRSVEYISTGNVVWDMVSGGGIPRRRITEVFGMEHSGKTAITLSMAAAAQKAGLVGIFMDHEQAWHGAYAERNYGLVQDGETFSVFQPDNIEEGDGIIEAIKEVDRIDYIIFDSVDAMRPKDTIERIQGKDVRIPGSHARAMSDLVHKLVPFARKKNCAIIFINQMRSQIIANKYEQAPGSGAGFSHGESYTTTGGHALRFYASLRMKMEYGGTITDEAGVDQVMGGQGAKVRDGTIVKIVNVKNKVYTPYLKGTTHFVFPTDEAPGGFSKGLDLLEMLKKRGRVRQVSTKFVYNGLSPQFAEYVSMGSKASSEEKFMANPALLKDAEALLKSLTGADGQGLEVAQKGVDFTSSDEDEGSFGKDDGGDLMFPTEEIAPIASDGI